jgi:hypothetical protein
MKTLALLILGSVFVLADARQALAAGAPETEDKIVFSLSGDDSLSLQEMDGARGTAGVNTLTSSQTLAASTTGNSLNVGGNLTNGDIAIGDNLGGFGSYVMNTGNNSTINSAVSLNIQIMPTP